MIRPIFTLCILIHASTGALAAPEDTAPAAAPAEKAAAAAGEVGAAKQPAESVGKFALKNRSTFQIRDEARAPFWPIGWVKGLDAPTKVQAAVAPPTLDERSFKVTSILLGQSGSRGDQWACLQRRRICALAQSRGPLRVRVQQISDGMVMLQHDKQALKVPLSRAELEAKPAELEVLSEDR
jgi:hypothetical protein